MVAKIQSIDIALDEDDFRALISGRIVEAKTAGAIAVRIILSDIGWDRMARAVRQAEDNARRGGRAPA